MKTEENENGTRWTGGMTNEEINKLAEEGAEILSFEKYCEQILFGESLQMKPADKKWALIIRDEMMRRFSNWRQRVTVISNETGKPLHWSEASPNGGKRVTGVILCERLPLAI